jgi:enoyl-CoA hydratase/carnithine racemase
MAYQFATYETKGRVGIVTINRPERMNALHPPANFELHEIWNEFERDPDVWVGILTGAGDKAFSAGNDLRYTAEHGRDMVRSAETGFGGMASRTTCWKPILAAVNGYALGGGFEMALACDLIIAADHAASACPSRGSGSWPAPGACIACRA